MTVLRSSTNFILESVRPQIISFTTLAVTAECSVWRPVQLTYSSIYPLALEVEGNYKNQSLVRAKRMTEPYP